MGNSFGRLLRITTFGESHGGGVGVVLDGCPAGTAISIPAIQADLERRRPGQSKLVTQRKEPDEVEIVSGVKDGVALGTPIAMLVRNKDARSKDYDDMVRKFRPSHADYTYFAKYGLREAAGGGRASARETVGRVAAGAIAKTILASAGAEVVAWVESVGDVVAEVDSAAVTLADVEATPVRCPDPAAAATMIERIEAARKAGDSIGGVVAAVARGVPVGLGAPVFDKLEADLAKAMLSLPACKGFENGSGFAGTRMTGSAHNDPFYRADDGRIRTRKNDAGGILGGISSGEDIAIRVAFKPTSTIMREQETVDQDGNRAVLKPRGRHDPCVLPRAVPIVEAMMALVLADHLLRHRATAPL